VKRVLLKPLSDRGFLLVKFHSANIESSRYKQIKKMTTMTSQDRPKMLDLSAVGKFTRSGGGATYFATINNYDNGCLLKVADA